MRKTWIPGLLFILILGCKSRKITANSPEKFVIENLAEIVSEENLQKIYPEAEIITGMDTVHEGTAERPFSILYPNTQNEALIIWTDETKTDLYGILFSKKGKWKSKTEIEIGTSYKELVKLNKGPISFYGFGWDYGGAVDWNGGKLKNSNIIVFLAPKATAPNKFYGDKIIEAPQDEIEALQLSVQSIMYKKS